MKKHLFVPIIIVSVLSLSGCEATKKNIGQAAGVLIGGYLGSKYCSGVAKPLCVSLTALVGAWVGGKIGEHLDEQDQLKMAKATQSSLVLGEERSWSSPENNVSGNVEVLDTQEKNNTFRVKTLKDKVTTVPPLVIIGSNFKALTKSNVRGGPGTDYKVVDSLSENEIINVVGKVKDSDWYLVSKDGVGSGFVASKLLEQAPDAIAEVSEEDVTGDIEETEVASTVKCRTVKQTVNLADGSVVSDTLEACQSPTGWEIAS